MSKDEGKKAVPIPKWARFIIGGAAGMTAAGFVQPLECLKNRMQMSAIGGAGPKYRSSFHAAKEIVANEGFFALYNGLSAAVLRQATYTTTRMGVYMWMMETLSTDDAAPSFGLKAVSGMVAGLCGAFVGTPADVALVRMTSDGRLPASERRNYKNVMDALVRICREEGFSKMFVGVVPTMLRAMVVNAAQLATYSQAKENLIKTGHFKDNILAHTCASMISGFVTTLVSMPVDIAKTRIQNMTVKDGKPEYSGMLDVVGKIVSKEGPLALWKGFTPYYFRLGPMTVLILVFMEQFTKAFRVYYLKDTSGSGSGI